MKKYFDYLILICSVVFSVLVLLLMLAPGITATVIGTKVTRSVYELLNYGDTFRVGIFFTLLFTILLLIAAIGLLCIKILRIKFKSGKIVALCGALIALATGVLFFCTVPLIGEGGSSIVQLGAGSVFCGIFSILNCGVLAFYGVKGK